MASLILYRSIPKRIASIHGSHYAKSVVAVVIWAATTIGTLIPGEAFGANADAQMYSSVDEFYSQRNGAAAWSNADVRLALRDALFSVDDHGLSLPPDVERFMHTPDAIHEVADRALTEAWFMLARQLAKGKLPSAKFQSDKPLETHDQLLINMLNTALSTGYIRSSLDAVAPSGPEYVELVAEMRRVKAERENEVAVIVSKGPVLSLGDSGPRVRQLNRRLVQLGLLRTGSAPSFFDSATEQAVFELQWQSGIIDDGLVGPLTLSSLNLSRTVKINQLRVNLERWRWLPRDLGARYIRVNIAAFHVLAVRNGRVEQIHAAIVGRPYRQTPEFSDDIRYVVFNPWWETPHSIAVKDKLPHFQKDPGSVNRLGFQVLTRDNEPVDPQWIDWTSITPESFPYRLRQAPGPKNALGRVKIMFPNAHAVYLHDTPTRGLFAEHTRAFSSGCIRVQNPIELATWLTKDNISQDAHAVANRFAKGNEFSVSLNESVPVHITYFTVASDRESRVRYLDDIYSRDDEILTALDIH